MEKYTARHSGLKITPKMDDLIRRRTEPFVDSVGLSKPLIDLLAEAYIQGFQDALQAVAE